MLNRLLEPKSELVTHQWVNTVYGLNKVEDPHQWYRSLDFLIDHKEKLEQDLFTKDMDLFNQTIDVVLMDTTSIVYWGDGGKADKILDYGYSKQKRFDLKQVIVGIFMTKDGIPIGHEVYPGNTNDIKAFKEMIAAIKGRHSIRRVVIVCDRGMVSKENLNNLRKDGYEYVVGMRMRQLRKMDVGSVLETEDMCKVSDTLSAKEIEYEGRRLIVC
ncbi:MAG: IS1634 family transposase, partial [Candidatus Omnitrophica bacterium]|nr:IS1634 family transposase [Candidatus Omnitrophota bacterium]